MHGVARHSPSRHAQHRHSARCAAGPGRHHVQPGCDPFRGPAAAGVPGRRHARGRGRTGRRQVRRRAGGLYGRLDRAGADPVRRRLAYPAGDLPQRAGARGHAGDRRRHDHGGVDRSGRQVPARHELERVVAGGCGRGLDRCRGGVLPGPRPRPAPAPPRRRYARGRIRQQRSVRGPAHRPSGRVSVGGRRVVGTRAGGAGRASRARHHHRLFSAGGPSCSCSTGSRWRRACTRRS